MGFQVPIAVKMSVLVFWVDLQEDTNVSEEHVSSITKATLKMKLVYASKTLFFLSLAVLGSMA
jgi:hypothetical protein